MTVLLICEYVQTKITVHHGPCLSNSSMRIMGISLFCLQVNIGRAQKPTEAFKHKKQHVLIFTLSLKKYMG